MWFATYDGINKYDGYAFTVYQHNEDDPHSIANDIARIVKTDSRGRVWIGTREGLSWYDEEKDQFKNYFYEKNGKRLQVNGIAEISPTQLLISTPEQLALFDIDKEVFIDDFFGMPTHRIVASALYRYNDFIYIGTEQNGLYRYSISQKAMEKEEAIANTKKIQAILQQSPTQLWIATEGAGLLLFNPKTQEVKNYQHVSGNSKAISSNYIRSLALDSQNRLSEYLSGSQRLVRVLQQQSGRKRQSVATLRAQYIHGLAGRNVAGYIFRRAELLPSHPQPV